MNDDLLAKIIEHLDSHLDSRLKAIESLLQQLVSRQTLSLPPHQASDVQRDIAMVRASGGDLIAHLRAKAKRQMAEEREAKKKARGAR